LTIYLLINTSHIRVKLFMTTLAYLLRLSRDYFTY